MAWSHLTLALEKAVLKSLEHSHQRWLLRCRLVPNAIRAKESLIRGEIRSEKMLGESHFRCASVRLLLGLLFVASLRESPAQAVMANQEFVPEIRLSPGAAKAAFPNLSRNDHWRLSGWNRDPILHRCEISSDRIIGLCSGKRMQADRNHVSNGKKACFSTSELTAAENDSGILAASGKDLL